jgi:hypothetical protein
VPSVPDGATGTVAGRAAAGRESRMWSQVRSTGWGLLPSRRPSVVSLSTPTPAADCRAPWPVRGLRGIDYSIRGAMPACDEMIKRGRDARALVQGCGRRPAASGTTAWARRRPGGGESARTSRPLTTRRFAATGLSPPSALTLAALLCFARNPSMAWSRCLGRRALH